MQRRKVRVQWQMNNEYEEIHIRSSSYILPSTAAHDLARSTDGALYQGRGADRNASTTFSFFSSALFNGAFSNVTTWRRFVVWHE
jgi:hypothetical protein